MTDDILIAAVRQALRGIADPCSIAAGIPIDLTDMGLVTAITVADGQVTVQLQLTSPFCMQIGLISDQITGVVGALEGVTAVSVDIDHTAEWLPTMVAPEAQRRLRAVRPFPVLTVAEP
jgi:metal-sulfur cluster biosynthetic enzyme